jgi:hypothetical protein
MDAFRQMTGPMFKPPSVSPSSQHQPHNSTGSATHPSPYARSYPPASTLDRLLGNTGTGAPSDFTFGGADRLDFGYGSTSTSNSGAGVGGGGGGGRKDAMQRSYGSLSEDRRDEDRFGTNNGFGDFQRGQNQSTTPSTGTGAGAGAGAAQTFPTAGPTAKRGSKACVACECECECRVSSAENRQVASDRKPMLISVRPKGEESMRRRSHRAEQVMSPMFGQWNHLRVRETRGEAREEPTEQRRYSGRSLRRRRGVSRLQ